MRLTTSLPLRLFVWALALFPLTLAVLFHTGYRPIPLSIQIPKRPALAFDQYAVDLRTIRPTTVQSAYYTFQNRGAEPVRITKITPSCGCLTPQLQGARDNVIDPDSRGRIEFRMQPANSTPGPHDYTVNVEYTDPDPREIQLLLKLVIPQTMWVDPPALIAYHPKGSTPTEQDFIVSDGRGGAFELTDVSIDTDLVEVAIGESSRSPTGVFQQSVRVVVAGELPSGRKQYLLRIKTSDRNVTELRVPILLEGPKPQSDGDNDHEQPIETEAEIVPSRHQQSSDEQPGDTKSGDKSTE